MAIPFAIEGVQGELWPGTVPAAPRRVPRERRAVVRRPLAGIVAGSDDGGELSASRGDDERWVVGETASTALWLTPTAGCVCLAVAHVRDHCRHSRATAGGRRATEGWGVVRPPERSLEVAAARIAEGRAGRNWPLLSWTITHPEAGTDVWARIAGHGGAEAVLAVLRHPQARRRAAVRRAALGRALPPVWRSAVLAWLVESSPPAARGRLWATAAAEESETILALWRRLDARTTIDRTSWLRLATHGAREVRELAATLAGRLERRRDAGRNTCSDA